MDFAHHRISVWLFYAFLHVFHLRCGRSAFDFEKEVFLINLFYAIYVNRRYHNMQMRIAIFFLSGHIIRVIR